MVTDKAAGDLCAMKMYKVSIENDEAVEATPVHELEHGDIGLAADKETVEWIAIECQDKKTAIEIANKVVKMIWAKRAA